MDTPERLVYSVDAANRLCAFDDAWDRFALANDAGHLTSSQVLGSSLLDHISNSTLRDLTGRLVDRVRNESISLELPFRCDAPDRIRDMRMLMAPGRNGEVIFESTLVRELPRETLALLDAQADRGGGFVRICSWCNRGAVGAEWVEVDEMIRRLGLFERGHSPLITHALCTACAEDLERSAC